jgi:hypothetical protein
MDLRVADSPYNSFKVRFSASRDKDDTLLGTAVIESKSDSHTMTVDFS